MNGAVPGRLLTQKATYSHTKTIFAKRGTMQRYHCGIKQFLNLLMHRQALNKFDTIKQGQKTVQELIQELTKYAARMVQYPDDYSFRRWLIATLRPSLQKEVLCKGYQRLLAL